MLKRKFQTFYDEEIEMFVSFTDDGGVYFSDVIKSDREMNKNLDGMFKNIKKSEKKKSEKKRMCVTQ
jgi:hypothetical protein